MFEAALAAELAGVLAEVTGDFKAGAAAARPDDLSRARRGIDEKHDGHRHSRLIRVFSRLILMREGRLQEARLAGLAQDKRPAIRPIAST